MPRVLASGPARQGRLFLLLLVYPHARPSPYSNPPDHPRDAFPRPRGRETSPFASIFVLILTARSRAIAWNLKRSDPTIFQLFMPLRRRVKNCFSRVGVPHRRRRRLPDTQTHRRTTRRRQIGRYLSWPGPGGRSNRCHRLTPPCVCDAKKLSPPFFSFFLHLFSSL